MIPILICLTLDGILSKNTNADTGDVIFIGYDGSRIPSDKVVYGCSNYVYLDDVDKFIRADDAIGINDLVRRGNALAIKVGDRAKVIKRDSTTVNKRLMAYLEVRMLDGEHKDKSVTILFHFACRLTEEKPQKKDPPTPKITKADAEKKKVAEEKKKLEEDESKAAELLKHAKRWLDEGNKEHAITRLRDLLKRFPKSKSAPEAEKLLKGIEG